MKQLHISNRTHYMLCGVADVSGVLRRYLSAHEADRDNGYDPCTQCAEREPLLLLALLDLGNGINRECWQKCGRAGTHSASYDGRWTCEDCIV